LFGAEPANFDVGGGATPEKVTEAFKQDHVKTLQ
jgi:succinyl-CoA synthetase beta subunit